MSREKEQTATFVNVFVLNADSDLHVSVEKNFVESAECTSYIPLHWFSYHHISSYLRGRTYIEKYHVDMLFHVFHSILPTEFHFSSRFGPMKRFGLLSWPRNKRIHWDLHPQSLTSNLKMMVSFKGIPFSRGLIFRWTMLNFRGVCFFSFNFQLF